MRRLLVVFLLLGLAQAQPLRIAAAANLSPVLPELVAAYEAAHPGVQVGVSYGASGQLVEQIRRGAPFQVFLSASPDYVRHLAEGGVRVYAEAPFARSPLVLYVPSRLGIEPTGFDVLADPRVRRVVVANPAYAPFGKAALAALRRAGWYARVEAKLIFAANVSQAAQMTVQGADAGFLALSSALHPTLRQRGAYWRVPDDLYPPLLQVAAQLDPGPEAQSFVAFLSGDEARAILARHGYATP
ncbi:molybdenum ABC transporter, periplasmic molybdate-binding protein [Oceanithermus profundus DSM 14977]|uniref:Molybdenum ABC transporter, periplasmic molybdate-binding protein n=1 Tax=Oceanithermus profundus (strain DSM 14977 / NBRC 100410 / VKM B-2274 / 506) TaxID=670487 RepID=E4U7J4_OCEP5|nr:molybdate ABC transporter substrate-binding protein [Oceanithermus profundus]ADR36443.1 molybdenum ABC transporter, periplasmic molybdate-binding protein [Oceanithermus profundus DSM 14977]